MTTKKCFKCSKIKSLDKFYKHPKMPDGRVNKCKECNKIDVRKNLFENKTRYTAYYKDRMRNNIDYIFIHRYSTMLYRTKGRSTRDYSVQGKEICTKSQFIKWCNSSKNLKRFKRLHKAWKKSGHNRGLCPSIDRIDNLIGYKLNNIRWITLSENSKKYIF